jgi:hypothetical protein
VVGVEVHCASLVQRPPGTQRRAVVSQTSPLAVPVQSAFELHPPGTHTLRESQ